MTSGLLLSVLFAAAADEGALVVAATHALAGHFASTRCEGGDASPFERLSAGLNSSPPGALKVDTGDLLGFSALGRHAMERGPAGLAQAVARLGLRARAMGHRDLGAPRAQRVDFTRALNAAGVPATLTNLKCDERRRALCEVVVTGDDPPLVLDGPQGKVGFISALSPRLLTAVSKGAAEGLSLSPAAEALSEAARRARAAGAERVIAVFDPAVGDEVAELLALVGALDASGSSPDLLLVNGVAGLLRTATAGAAMVPVVASRPGAALAVALRPGGPELLEAEAPAEADAEVERYARELNRELCRRYQRPFPRGTLDRALTRDEAASLVLDIMRERARAEVAILNRPAVSSSAPWPVEPPLTPLALMQVLPFENRLEVASVPGAALLAFLESPEAKQHFLRGAAKDGAWRINGRPLEPAQTYRVVTIDFVTESVGGAFAAAKPLEAGSLRDVVAEWLSVPRPGPLLAQPVDPAERARWWFSFRLQLDVSSVTVGNPNQAVFTDAQLARGQALSAVGETEARAIGDHPAYALEHQLRLRYGLLSATALDGTSAGVVNNIDLVTGRTLAFARKVFGAPRWYTPRPYFDFFLESELTRPETRPYHHLQLLPTVGLRFELFPQFALYLGGGVTWEVFARREDLNPNVAPAAAVLVAGWQLRPTKLVKLGERWLEAETNFDFWIRDVTGPAQSQARARFRLVLPLFSVLALTATYDLYLRSVRLQDELGRGSTLFGHSHDAYLGLQVALGQSYQSFSF